jgi:leucyl aminopeptidase
VAAALKRPEATGERGAIVEAFPSGKTTGARVMVVGLGEKDTLTPIAFREIAATVGRRLAAIQASTVHVHIETALGTLSAAQARNLGGFGQAFGEALGLLSWSRDHFKGAATDLKKRQTLTVCCLEESFGAGVEVGLALAESTNYARTLSEAPPNIATPDFIAKEAQQLAKRHGLSCRVLRGKDLETHEMVGIKTVGQASENEPCFIRLEYHPEKASGGARSKKPVVLVACRSRARRTCSR